MAVSCSEDWRGNCSLDAVGLKICIENFSAELLIDCSIGKVFVAADSVGVHPKKSNNYYSR